MSDEYIGITATLHHVRDKAVLLAKDDHKAWIPRSLIYGPDDSKLDDTVLVDCEISLRIMAWKVNQEGWG